MCSERHADSLLEGEEFSVTSFHLARKGFMEELGFRDIFEEQKDLSDNTG